MKKNKNNVKTLTTVFVILVAAAFSSVFTALKFQEPVSYSKGEISYDDMWETGAITESISAETVVIAEPEAKTTAVSATDEIFSVSSAYQILDKGSDINSDSETHTNILSETEAVTEQTENKRLININTATAEELQQLNGIGPVIAERIVEYAQTLGFKSIEEIKNVKGIGEKKFEAIKDKITV